MCGERGREPTGGESGRRRWWEGALRALLWEWDTP